MTNDEINAAISAWFEQKPAPLDWVIIDQPIPSAKGFWLHTNSGYERGDVSVTIPLDYFHSEDANARLLEAAKLTVSPYGPVGWHAFVATHWFAGKTAGGGQGEYWGIRTGDHVDSIVYENHADRKTAVVLSFLKFAGIPYENLP